MEANILQHCFIAVLEAYVFKLYLAAQSAVNILGVVAVYYLRLRVVYLDYLHGGSHKTLKVVDVHTQVSYGVRYSPDKSRDSYVLAHSKAALYKEDTAAQQHHYRKHVRQRFHIRRIFQPHQRSFLVCFRILAVRLAEFLYLEIFARECFYNAVARDILLRVGIQLREFFAQLNVNGAGYFFEHNRYHEDKGRYREEHQRHLPVYDKEIHHRGGEERERFHNALEYPRYRVANHIEVARQAGHKVARAVLIVKIHILPLNALKKAVAYLVYHALRRYFVGHVAGILADRAQQRKAYHAHQQHYKAVLIRLQIRGGVFARDVCIYYLRAEIRRCEIQRVASEREHQRRDVYFPIPFQIVPQPLYLKHFTLPP